MLGGRILVTGASGFAGRHIAALLAQHEFPLTLAVRTGAKYVQPGARMVDIGELSGQTDWGNALEGVGTIVHAAGLAHAPQADEDAFRRVNAEGTRSLVEAAARTGVATLINISSIAVYDPALDTTSPITEEASCRPKSAYGRSKLEAEQVVATFASKSRSAIQLRPPLIHGPAAPGNWGTLVALARKSYPLPSIAPHNRRSVLSVHNLANAIVHILKDTALAEASGVYNIADDHFVSTDDLLRFIRRGLGRSPVLIPLTHRPLKIAATLAGYGATFDKLAGDLPIDTTKFQQRFGWTPPLHTGEAIMRDLKRA